MSRLCAAAPQPHHPDCELIEIIRNGMPHRPGLPVTDQSCEQRIGQRSWPGR